MSERTGYVPLRETKQGLLERLDNLNDHYSTSGKLGNENFYVFKEAAAAIREALDVIAQAESLIRNGGIVPIKGEAWSRLDAYLWKYQEIK